MYIPIKHISHVIVLVSFTILVCWFNIKNQLKLLDDAANNTNINNITTNSNNTIQNLQNALINQESMTSIIIQYFRYFSQLIILLLLPEVIFNFFGLTLFNAFPREPKQKIINPNLPHIRFRVVTRGLFPELVQRNINKNYQTCKELGLENFCIEVVTDNKLSQLMLVDPDRCKETVVPKTYKSERGALYKARALQYALEDEVSDLKDGDYIVHLDEETVVTRNSVLGIIDFIEEGKHDFGQGLITYANQGVVNWITTLADSFRVADDMGKLRFQFKVFHKPIYSWKGSYVVTRYTAEREVSFDNGPDGSIAEDCYFALVAFSKGYSFDFIEGEMLERSPFTIMDLIRQRRRWVQGLWLVVHASEIPFLYRFCLTLHVYGWVLLPLTTIGNLLPMIFPIPNPLWITVIGSICFPVTVYMYIFGVLKTFNLKETPLHMMIIYVFGALITLSLNVIIENIAITWGLFTRKHQFYIVNKETTSSKISMES